MKLISPRVKRVIFCCDFVFLWEAISNQNWGVVIAQMCADSVKASNLRLMHYPSNVWYMLNWLTRLLRDSTSTVTTVNVMIPRQWSGLNASELAYTHTFLDSHTEQYTNIIYIVEQKYWCQVAIKFCLAMPVWRFESGMR